MDLGQATGIPQGVHIVRIGEVKPEEYYWVDGAVKQGPRPGVNIVVALNGGYIWVYDIAVDGNHPALVFDPPKVVVWRVTVTNQIELDDIIGLEKRVREKGGLKIESEIQGSEGDSGETGPADAGDGNQLAAVSEANSGSGSAGVGVAGAGLEAAPGHI